MIMTEFLAFDPSRELGRVCGRSATAKFYNQGELDRAGVVGVAEMVTPGVHPPVACTRTAPSNPTYRP